MTGGLSIFQRFFSGVPYPDNVNRILCDKVGYPIGMLFIGTYIAIVVGLQRIQRIDFGIGREDDGRFVDLGNDPRRCLYGFGFFQQI